MGCLSPQTKHTCLRSILTNTQNWSSGVHTASAIIPFLSIPWIEKIPILSSMSFVSQNYQGISKEVENE